MTQMQILLAQTTTTTEDDGNPLDFVGDFFDSEEWLVIRNVTLFFLVVFWLASAYWVYKDAAGMLAALSALGRRLVATGSSSPRSLPAEELAALGREFFDEVEVVPQPVSALARAREIAGAEGAVLVTGSLYLLMDLASVRPSCLPWQASASG